MLTVLAKSRPQLVCLDITVDYISVNSGLHAQASAHPLPTVEEAQS